MSKNYRLHFMSLIVIVLALVSLSAVAAQDKLDDQPLLQMLANVPDNASSRTEINFNDRKAVELAYPNAKMPANWAEFQSFNADKGKSDSFKPINLWWKVWKNQQSSLMGRYMGLSDEMPNVVGFDFFNVEQELNYGMPPQQTLQLKGQFDLAKVRLALTSQGFTKQDQSGVEVWCGPDGCDSGTKQNLKDRNPANPFGGDLGRKWPMILQENDLIGTPDLTIMQNHVAVKAGNTPSLADAPEYRAAVEALTQNGVLMQANFWDGEILASMSNLDPIIMTAPAEQRKAILSDILKDYETLPVYKLLAFGDIANDTKAAGEVALVYNAEEDAKKAAEIIPKRIATFKSLVSQRPLTQILEDRGVTAPDVQVVESKGQYVVLVSLTSTKTSDEDILAYTTAEEGGSVTINPPGLVYRYLVSSALQRDLGWLGTI
ncbi:MAG: hypothetical protein H0X30_36060, partial [Anaerolineae bacterium]|nr:hypothetical protein [Anaerolineae bacterium]